MSDVPSDNIMMIGPSRAGKTTLLSVLRLASARRLKNSGMVEIRPINDDASLLFERALDIRLTGSIVPGPTTEAKKYTFALTCEVQNRVKVEHFQDMPGRWPWSEPVKVDKSYYKLVKEPRTFTLTVLDGKGGDVFDGRDELEDEGTYQRRRSELVQLAAQSAPWWCASIRATRTPRGSSSAGCSGSSTRSTRTGCGPRSPGSPSR